MAVRFGRGMPARSSGRRRKKQRRPGPRRSRPSTCCWRWPASTGSRRGTCSPRPAWTGTAIRAALDREFRQSLAAAGVTLAPGGLPAASRDPNRRARLAASGKLVLERALKADRGERPDPPGHLLLGVLAAQAGTVPRALALAGVDQGDLAARTRQALERSQP